MDKTVESYRMALESEINRWNGFARALLNDELLVCSTNRHLNLPVNGRMHPVTPPKYRGTFQEKEQHHHF